ncbi:hypothetical protein AB6A40_009354 [Gnathostoma spinigerum]|uniref:Uncharacterized protein n=1 Tax=Gnathostoma spinigerum TaxID=75299 RepID=A0ABD6ESY9_9BILA
MSATRNWWTGRLLQRCHLAQAPFWILIPSSSPMFDTQGMWTIAASLASVSAVLQVVRSSPEALKEGDREVWSRRLLVVYPGHAESPPFLQRSITPYRLIQ